MSIKLNDFIFENFNSYVGVHKISFLEKQGNLVLIRGIDELDKSSNGAGKSTIVDALVFTIFGRSMKKELNLDDLINDKSIYLKTSLCLEDSENGIIKNKYRIERTRSKSPTFSQCKLYENDKCVSNDLTNTETQNRIEKLIGLDYQMFVNNNVLNPELFRFVKGNSSQKIDILERVLNLNIVSKIFSILSCVAKEDQLVFDKNNTEYYALKTTLENLLQQKEFVNKNIKENIDILKNKNNEILKEVTKIEKNRNEKDLIIASLYQKIEEKNENIYKIDKKKTQLEHEIESSKKTVKYYEKNEKCHVCKQPIPNRDKILENEKNRLIEYSKEINESSVEINKIKSSPEFDEYENIVKQRSDYADKIKDLKLDLKKNKETIEKFASFTAEVGKVDEISNKLHDAEIEWKDSKNKLEITEFWRELLTPKSKTRMSLAADLIKVLNLNIYKYVNNFYNKNFSLRFDIIDNNIEETIIMETARRKYDQLSSGEKQKVDIVIVLSLLDIAMTYFKNNRLKFLIIDEATDHLDNVWARYVIEFIKQYAVHLNMMCLFISHHSVIEELNNLFDNEILAVKGLNGSSYIAKNNI